MDFLTISVYDDAYVQELNDKLETTRQTVLCHVEIYRRRRDGSLRKISQVARPCPPRGSKDRGIRSYCSRNWSEMKHAYALCIKCGCRAVWFYVPIGGREYCDNCVPRGCSCNTDPDTGEEELDEKGRRYPCCEFEHINDELTKAVVWEKDNV